MRFSGFDKFIVVGISHRVTPVEVREKFSLDTNRKSALLAGAQKEGITSLFVISTCNRTEIVARQATLHVLIRLLTDCTGGSLEEFHKYGVVYKGSSAVEHLFKIAAGLDSQVLGDLQIVKQVKDGYELSIKHRIIDSSMHRLMQHVFRAHKRSRNETSIGHGAATVAYAAVKYIQRSLDSLHDKSILLVGTGKMGCVTCKNLLNKGTKQLTLINRTRHHADILAGRYNVDSADMSELPQKIADADLVIVATGSSEPVISMKHMQEKTKKPECKVMLDLSVPRNIDVKVGELAFVKLVNMDMLRDATDHVNHMREKEVPQVEKIIDEEFNRFGLWLEEQRVVPTIKALTNKFDKIRSKELKCFHNKIPSEDMEEVEILTRKIINKIAAYSIEHLRDRHPSDNVTKMVEDMFKLNTEKILK